MQRACSEGCSPQNLRNNNETLMQIECLAYLLYFYDGLQPFTLQRMFKELNRAKLLKDKTYAPFLKAAHSYLEFLSFTGILYLYRSPSKLEFSFTNKTDSIHLLKLLQKQFITYCNLEPNQNPLSIFQDYELMAEARKRRSGLLPCLSPLDPYIPPPAGLIFRPACNACKFFDATECCCSESDREEMAHIFQSPPSIESLSLPDVPIETISLDRIHFFPPQ